MKRYIVVDILDFIYGAKVYVINAADSEIVEEMRIPAPHNDLERCLKETVQEFGAHHILIKGEFQLSYDFLNFAEDNKVEFQYLNKNKN